MFTVLMYSTSFAVAIGNVDGLWYLYSHDTGFVPVLFGVFSRILANNSKGMTPAVITVADLDTAAASMSAGFTPVSLTYETATAA